MIKVLSIVGTRPEAIKMAPLIKKINKDKIFNHILLATYQHKEMLNQVFNLFNIKPDISFDIMKKNQSLTYITVSILQNLTNLFNKIKPDIVLIQGDTTTVMASALAAFYNKIQVGHVEAGLRTQDKYQPFPEELNRRITSQIANLHFAPTKIAYDNLIKENINKNKVFLTGNTIIDAIYMVKDNLTLSKDLIYLNDIIKSKKVLLVEMHRRENLGRPMENVMLALKDIALKFKKEVVIVFPVHKNPKVREVVFPILKDLKNVFLLEPVDYITLLYLLKHSFLVLTDSGGIQEESSAFSRPVYVLRNKTERIESILAGISELIGTDREKVYEYVKKAIVDRDFYLKYIKNENPYGNGDASFKIVSILKQYFNL